MTDLNGDADPGSAGSSRKLADILREAGIDGARAGGRRRRRDEIEAANAELSLPSASTDSEQPSFGHGSDPGTESEYRFETGEVSGSLADDYNSLSAYLLADPDARDQQPHPVPPRTPPTLPAKPAPKPGPTAPKTPAHVPARKLAPRTDTGPVTAFGWVRPGTGWPEDPEPAVDSSVPLSAAPSRYPSMAGTDLPTSMTETATGSAQASVSAPKARAGTARARAGTAEATPTPAASSAPAHGNRSASPLASAPAAEADEPDSAVPLRGGAASWLILAVELLAAVGLGVAAWYAFSALWELLPYVAAFTGPLVVTGLVAVAGALRARTGRNPLGLPTLCILVFAGTVLVVLPAATVIIP